MRFLILFSVLLITTVFGCSINSNANQCELSTNTSQLFNWVKETYVNSLKSIEQEPILVFPKELIGDSKKCGIRSRIKFNDTEVIIEEYKFSLNYIEDHAMEATLGEFFFPSKSEFPYSQVFNEQKGRCIVFKIHKEKSTDESGMIWNEIVDHYSHMKGPLN